MRIADASKGFIICFLLNLLFNFEWGVFALILYLLHLWLKIPLLIALIFLGIWVGIAFILALLVSVHAILPSKPMPKMEKKYTAPVQANVSSHSFGSATAAFLKEHDTADSQQAAGVEVVQAAQATTVPQVTQVTQAVQAAQATAAAEAAEMVAVAAVAAVEENESTPR